MNGISYSEQMNGVRTSAKRWCGRRIVVPGLAVAAVLLLAACDRGAESDSDQNTEAGDHPAGMESASDFNLTLKPFLDASGAVAGIEVHSTIDAALEEPAKPFSLAAPVVYANVFGVADRVKQLQIRDAAGEISVTVDEDAPVPGGFPYFRHWRATRVVEFPIEITYRSLVQPAGEPPGPAFGIRPSGGGVSGAGSGFLVIPENTTSANSRVTWDLSAFGDGAAGLTSFGEDAFQLDGPPAALMQGWFMAGPLERYPEAGARNGFSAAWLGEFPFDEQAEMEFVGGAYEFIGKYFGYLDPPPRYRVFMRSLETPPYGGGTALVHSFMLSRAAPTANEMDGEGPRGTFFHEMIHEWVGGIEAPYGISSWFSEGLTTYYSQVLPMRGGFTSVDDFVDDINAISRGYYSNPAREMSAQAITDVGFGNNDIRHIPYYRGALYFADLDARLRKASGGARSLDIFMREIFVKRENDPDFTFDHDKWTELVTAEIGPAAAQEFQSVILDGAVIIPDPTAFGPCLRPHPTSYDTEESTLAGIEWSRVEDVDEETCRTY